MANAKFAKLHSNDKLSVNSFISLEINRIKIILVIGDFYNKYEYLS
jgi:hypothetical protein